MHSTFPQQAVELFQLLVSVGAMPGEDFSVDPSTGYWHLSDRTYHRLQQAYPEVDWETDLLPLVPPDDDDAIAALHAHLGIDFVPRLLVRVGQRIHTLPLRQACWYVRQLLAGVEQRTQINLYDRLRTQLNGVDQALLDYLLWHEGNPEPCGLWLEDVVLAAGGTPEDVHGAGAEVMLSERGMRLLATVWMGDYDVYGALAS
jgi:hypothetical protein